MCRGDIALMLIIMAAGACGKEVLEQRPPASAGATLVPVDSVVLAEADSAYVGRIAGFTTSTAGNIFVADQLSSRILVFDGHGRFVRFIGRKGSGPAELLQPLRVGLQGDSLLWVSDFGPRSVKVFRVADAAAAREMRVDGMLTDLTLRNDTAFLAVADFGRNTGISIVGPHAHPTSFGVRPGRLRRWRVLMPYVSPAALALTGDSIAIIYSAYDAVFFYGLDGGARGAVTLPAVRRRQVREDAESSLRANATLNDKQALFSTAYTATRLRSGHLAVVHMDFAYSGKRPTATGFLSLLAPDRKKACPDAPIPLSADSWGHVAFRGDTLLTLNQSVTKEGTAKITLTAYTIALATCQWLPTSALLDP